MKCIKCGSEKLQIVSDYVELNKKFRSAGFVFALLFGIVMLIFGFILDSKVILGSFNAQSDTIRVLVYLFEYLTAKSVGIILIISSINFLLILFLLSALRPRIHRTRIVAVCQDCGEIMILSEYTPE